jgi:hypothetical protein
LSGPTGLRVRSCLLGSETCRHRFVGVAGTLPSEFDRDARFGITRVADRMWPLRALLGRCAVTPSIASRQDGRDCVSANAIFVGPDLETFSSKGNHVSEALMSADMS